MMETVFNIFFVFSFCVIVLLLTFAYHIKRYRRSGFRIGMVRSKKAFIIFKEVDGKWKFFQSAKWVEEFQEISFMQFKPLYWNPIQWLEPSDCDHQPILMHPKMNEVYKPSPDNTGVSGDIGLVKTIPICRRCGKYYTSHNKKEGKFMEMLPYWFYLLGSLSFAAGSAVVLIEHYFGFTFL